jgi:hypothetical protein
MKVVAMGGPLVARSIWGCNPPEAVTVEGLVYDTLHDKDATS